SANERAEQHSRHGDQTPASARPAATHEATIRRGADDGQREDGGGEVGHGELAGGGVLDAHGDAKHDDERVAESRRWRIAGAYGEDGRDSEEAPLYPAGDGEQAATMVAEA